MLEGQGVFGQSIFQPIFRLVGLGTVVPRKDFRDTIDGESDSGTKHVFAFVSTCRKYRL
jgi:hypothetical protein